MKIRGVSPWVVCLLVSVAVSILYSTKALSEETDIEAARTAALIKGAKEEEKLTIYFTPNVRNYSDLIKRFEEKYPFLKVGFYQAGERRLLQKILIEVNSKRYIPDIIDSRGFEINILKEKNLLMKYISPNYKFIPSEFIDNAGYYAANNFTLRVIAYNTRLIPPKDVPKNYQDLLDPKWSGKLYMDERDDEWFGNMLDIMGKEKGMTYMKKLASQKIHFRNGRLLTATLLAAGELPIFLTASGHTIEQLKEQGAPIDWVVFEPIAVAVGSAGISSYSPHPNAAKLYINFLTSKEGQELVSRSFGKSPVRSDAKQRYSSLDVSKRKLYYSSVTTDYSKFNKEFRETFMMRK